MGNKHHKSSDVSSVVVPAFPAQPATGPPLFQAIPDQYHSIEEVQRALQNAGLEVSELIIGIDYTISNKDAGKRTFGGKSLHSIQADRMNPYQTVISVIGRTLEPFDADHQIPVYGFGDKSTQDKTVAPFIPDRPCNGFQEVLQRYTEITPLINLAGPTSFAPLIRQAIAMVQYAQSYHILIIIADGQLTPDSEFGRPTSETIDAIVEASNHPLSIIMVGVGDGPWDEMHEFDDGLPQRRFDNFQFVEFAKAYQGANPLQADVNFAIAALQEIPSQYYYIRQLGLLRAA